MNKRNKLKKGIIKVTYFDKNCNCNYSVPTLKKVSNKIFVTCESCNCVINSSNESLYYLNKDLGFAV
jgi:hypothetical protein